MDHLQTCVHSLDMKSLPEKFATARRWIEHLSCERLVNFLYLHMSQQMCTKCLQMHADLQPQATSAEKGGPC